MTDTLADALAEGVEKSDHIDVVTALEQGEDVGDTRRVGYRFDITNADGRSTVEQQAYYRVNGGQLTYLRIDCSGYRPQSGAAS